jgi:hypothetical protein
MDTISIKVLTVLLAQYANRNESRKTITYHQLEPLQEERWKVME